MTTAGFIGLGRQGAGWPRASALEMAYYRAIARLDEEAAEPRN